MKVGRCLKTALEIIPRSEQVHHVRKWTNASAFVFRFFREGLASTVVFRLPSVRTQSTQSDGVLTCEAHRHSLRKTPEASVFPIVMGVISKESKALSATGVFKSVYHCSFSSRNFLQCVYRFLWREPMEYFRQCHLALFSMLAWNGSDEKWSVGCHQDRLGTSCWRTTHPEKWMPQLYESLDM